MAFPTSPTDGQLYNGYQFNSTVQAWEKQLGLMPSSIGSVPSVIYDYTSNEYDGTNYGAVTLSNGMQFSGTNNYINIPYAFSMSTVTVEFYLEWNNLGTDNVEFICEGDANNKLMIHTGGASGINGIRFVLFGSNVLDTTGIIESGNHHYAFVYNGNTAIAYRDSVMINSQIMSMTSLSTTLIDIGRRPDGATYYLNGSLSDFRIWNTPRTQQEIQDNMGRVLIGNETGLVAYYPMPGRGNIQRDYWY